MGAKYFRGGRERVEEGRKEGKNGWMDGWMNG